MAEEIKEDFGKVTGEFTDEMTFENHLCAKMDALYRKTFSLLVEACSYDIDPDERDFVDVLDKSEIICCVLDHMEGMLHDMGIDMCYPYYETPVDENGAPTNIEEEIPCYKAGHCQRGDCPLLTKHILEKLEEPPTDETK